MSESIPVPSGLRHSWPAWVVVILVVLGALYAFAPRPDPAFPPTTLQPDKLMLNALARSASMLIAAGEQGHILIAETAEGPWQEASVTPRRGSTLTALHSTNGIVLAGGHDGWILRSEDGGRTWKEVFFDTEYAEPVLALSGPHHGRLYAVGGFGRYLVSDDHGQTWRREAINEIEDAQPAAPAEDVPSADEDPFAGFSASLNTGIGDRHLNGLGEAPDGTLFLVGERGLIARSTDQGQSWKQLPSIYNGSFFGILVLPPSGLLAYGMRGNAFYSRDLGATWAQSEIPEGLSLFGGAVQTDGSVVLAGENSAILLSRDGGATFEMVSQGERLRFSAVLPTGDGWLAAGEGGLRRVSATGAAGATP
jgi:photosystem II stability/assembly factor-like uncharacterized protein